MELSSQKDIREFKGFQGRAGYIPKFISNLSEMFQPFLRLMQMRLFEWDEHCEPVFVCIKACLTTLLFWPVLSKESPGVSAFEHSLDALLAYDAEGKENALYYLIRKLVGSEERYAPIEKVCMGHIFAI